MVSFERIVQHVDRQFGQLIASQTEYTEIHQPIVRFECVNRFDFIVIQIDVVHRLECGSQRCNATDLKVRTRTNVNIKMALHLRWSITNSIVCRIENCCVLWHK